MKRLKGPEKKNDSNFSVKHLFIQKCDNNFLKSGKLLFMQKITIEVKGKNLIKKFNKNF